jgi:hypothetical protein
LVGSGINAVYGVLLVLVEVGLGRVVGAVCDIPVDAGPDIVLAGREVDDSQRLLSIMTELCPASRLLVV